MKGFTLLEALICLAILSLLVSISVSYSTSSKEKHRVKSSAAQFKQLLSYSRQQAIAMQQPITLCNSANAVDCAKDKHWQQKYLLVFQDRNKNQQVDQNDIVLQKNPFDYQNIHMVWRSFGNKTYLRWLPNGLTDYQNGSFIICPNTAEVQHARILIMNANGRAYYGEDTDQDGIVENSQLKNIDC